MKTESIRVGGRELATDRMSSAVRVQVESALGKSIEPECLAPDVIKVVREPNKTETRYRREILDRRNDLVAILYVGLTFRMANGHRYTPDWVCQRKDGGVECHEVKGAYRLHSHQRARLAWDQVAVEWPRFVWVWAVWSGTEWMVSCRNLGGG